MINGQVVGLMYYWYPVILIDQCNSMIESFAIYDNKMQKKEQPVDWKEMTRAVSLTSTIANNGGYKIVSKQELDQLMSEFSTEADSMATEGHLLGFVGTYDALTIKIQGEPEATYYPSQPKFERPYEANWLQLPNSRLCIKMCMAPSDREKFYSFRMYLRLAKTVNGPRNKYLDNSDFEDSDDD